jgi:oxalate decarboxylase/phosphoglucose isomerase-like protein (cupin superfamily)
VGPGDVCLIEVGQFHSLENNTDEEVEFMALIYNEAGYDNR